jgi:pilus assembly protein CpaC
VLLGKSVVINLEARIKRILVSNPEAVQAVPTTPNQVVVTAKAVGASSLILWDETGRSRMLDVLADVDVSGLRDGIQLAFPSEPVQVEAAGDRLILSGAVSNPDVIDSVAKMAGLFSKNIINTMTLTEVPHEKQITGGVPSSTRGTATFSVSDILNIFLFRPDINIATTIKALQAKNILQILAEPNLLAMNGRPARFLAGGEFPFPVVQGGTNFTAVTIQFRPFGVRLEFTGTIAKDNTIRLQVSPEVSTLDFTNALTISGFVVPAISTRRAETEIELKDGQSFGIAGLIDQRAQAQFSKIPGIGDIPILGQLFRSRNISRSRLELLVLVTPHVVDPVRAGGTPPSPPKQIIPYLNAPRYDRDLPQGEGQGAPPEKSTTPRE